MNVAGLLRSRVRLARNAWRRPAGARGARGAGSRHPLVAALLLAILAWIFAWGLSSLFGALAASGASAADTAPILALALTAALFGMLVFDVHHAVSSMLLDPDLDWFRRAPVRARAMFGIKLLDALPRTAALLVVIAIPALAAWSEKFAAPLWSLLLWPLWLAALWAAPMGLGTMLGMALLRVMPARRVRDALGLLSTLTLIALWLVNSFLLPELVSRGEDLAVRLQAGGALPHWLAWISPGHAVAAAARAAAEGSVTGALSHTAQLAGFAALALGLAVLVAHMTFVPLQNALAAAVADGRVTRPPPGARRRRAARPGRAPRGLARALILRDVRLFTRDWTVLSDVLTAAVLWTILPVLSSRLLTAPPGVMLRAMLVALTVGLGYEIAARSAPFERRALALARLAPLTPIRWVMAKWLACAALAAPILVVVAGILALLIPVPAGEWAATLSMTCSALALALGLGLWTGLHFGDTEWTNPRAMLTVTGRIVATGLLLTQAVGWLALSAAGWIGTGPGGESLPLWVPPVLAAGLLAAVLTHSAGRFSRNGQGH